MPKEYRMLKPHQRTRVTRLSGEYKHSEKCQMTDRQQLEELRRGISVLAGKAKVDDPLLRDNKPHEIMKKLNADNNNNLTRGLLLGILEVIQKYNYKKMKKKKISS